MAGVVRSAPLPPLSEKVRSPKPKTEIGPDGKTRQLTVTMAAGMVNPFQPTNIYIYFRPENVYHRPQDSRSTHAQ